MPERINIKNIVLFILLLVAGVALFTISFPSHQRSLSTSKSQAVLVCHRAELNLRAADALNVLPSVDSEPSDKESADDDISATEFIGKLKTGKSRLLANEAQETLESATKQDEQNLGLLARKIVLEFELNESTQEDWKCIASIGSKGSNIVEAEASLPIFQQLYQNNDAKIKQKFVLPTDFSIKLEKLLGTGWFKERALLKFYKLSKQSAQYHQLLQAIKDKSWGFVFKLALLGVGIFAFGFSGLLILLWRLCFYKPNPSLTIAIKESAANVRYGWPAVFIVFYAWFCTQLLFAQLVAHLRKINVINISSSHSLSLSLMIAVIYLLSNGPALAYVYLFALRPQKISFLKGINWRFKGGASEPFKLFGMAYLAWMAAIPLVLFSYLLSIKLFNTSGSSNPIIAIVMEAAGTNNLSSILLFYLTLGVMAPCVEESLFRGFFYAFLRSRYGPIFSNLVSAGLFAVAHLDPGGALPLFCLGSVFAYLFEVTGSVVPAVIAHGLWNSAVFTLVLLLFGN